MKVEKKKKLNPKKIVAKLKASFVIDDEIYDMYLYGIIIYEDGDYKTIPTKTDRAITAEEKKSVLNQVLEDQVPVLGGDGEYKIYTKDDPDFLEKVSEYRGNMYGGLIIVDSDEHDKIIEELEKSTKEVKESSNLEITKNKRMKQATTKKQTTKPKSIESEEDSYRKIINDPEVQKRVSEFLKEYSF